MSARDTVLGLFFAVDRHDWDRVAALLAPEVRSDYTSLWGGEPATTTGAGLVGAWRSSLPGFDATHHHVTVVSVDGAVVTANGTATHRIGDAFWVVGGHYTIDVDPDGRVGGLTFVATWETGDRSLVATAGERAAAG